MKTYDVFERRKLQMMTMVNIQYRGILSVDLDFDICSQGYDPK